MTMPSTEAKLSNPPAVLAKGAERIKAWVEKSVESSGKKDSRYSKKVEK